MTTAHLFSISAVLAALHDTTADSLPVTRVLKNEGPN